MVRGRQVQAAVGDVSDSGGDGVKGPPQALVQGPLPAGASSWAGKRVGAFLDLSQVEQVGPFGFVEPEGAGDGFEYGG